MWPCDNCVISDRHQIWPTGSRQLKPITGLVSVPNRWYASRNDVLKITQKFSDYSQKKSVIFLFSSINQAKAHKNEFEHFIYEKKQGFDDINPN